MNIHLIINPNAGKKRGLASGVIVQEQLEQAGFGVVSHVSTYPGHSVKLAAGLPSDAQGVLAVGGDGTLFEVLNGLMNNPSFCEKDQVHGQRISIPLGQIPVGTGNSFIKDLQIKDFQESIDVVIRGNTRLVDVGLMELNSELFYFINLLGAGFVSSVAHSANRFKGLGALSYIIGVVQETLRLNPGNMKLTLDDEVVEQNAVFVEICNSRYTGGEMKIAPGASIDDGFFDVVYMDKVNRRKLLSLFPKIFSGEHILDPVIHVKKAREVRLETTEPWHLTPDGETFGSTPFTARILPGAVRMFSLLGGGVDSF